VLPFEVASGSEAEEAVALRLEDPETARGLRVLVCEDDPVNRKVAEHILAKLHHQVETAPNGESAVEVAARTRFDLVLMDCQLPDIDGFEAARRIRASGASAGVPVIALTAASLAEDRQRCQDAGMQDFLSKPLSLAALSDALTRLQGAKATSREPLDSSSVY
jgi:CheY-like chemotaxis protein